MPIDSTIRSAWRTARSEFTESALGRTLNLGVKAAVSAGFAGLVALGPANAQEGKFYAKKVGQPPTEIDQTTAQRLHPDYWEVYYFRRGTTPNSNPAASGHWGSVINDNLTELMEEVHKSIEADNAFRDSTFCQGACRNNDWVYDNYFGPIAFMPAENTEEMMREVSGVDAPDWGLDTAPFKSMSRKLPELEEKAELMQKWWEKFKAFSGTEDPEEALKGLQEKVRSLDPSAVQGYIENLRLGTSGIPALRAALQAGISYSGNVFSMVDDVSRELDAALKYGQTINRALSTEKTTQPNTQVTPQPNTFSGNYTFNFPNDLRAVDEQVTLGAQLKVYMNSRYTGDLPGVRPTTTTSVASPSETTAAIGQGGPPWTISVNCDDPNTSCVKVQSTPCGRDWNCINTAPTSNGLYFYVRSEDEANDFVARFNARKNGQQTAPAPNVSIQPANPTGSTTQDVERQWQDLEREVEKSDPELCDRVEQAKKYHFIGLFGAPKPCN